MDYGCDFHGFKVIFDVLGEVEHMGSGSMPGAEDSLHTDVGGQ